MNFQVEDALASLSARSLSQDERRPHLEVIEGALADPDTREAAATLSRAAVVRMFANEQHGGARALWDVIVAGRVSLAGGGALQHMGISELFTLAKHAPDAMVADFAAAIRDDEPSIARRALQKRREAMGPKPPPWSEVIGELAAVAPTLVQLLELDDLQHAVDPGVGQFTKLLFGAMIATGLALTIYAFL